MNVGTAYGSQPSHLHQQFHQAVAPGSQSTYPSYSGSQSHTEQYQQSPVEGPSLGTMAARDGNVTVEQLKVIKLPWVGERHGRRYELQVVQQPQRARMCGFGDKDRRPITPPPCVRVLITDVATGSAVSLNEVEHQLFVIHVDLWDETGSKEVNLVRSASATPSISSTSHASFTQLEASQASSSNYQHIMPGNREMGYAGHAGHAGPSGHTALTGHGGVPYSHSQPMPAFSGYQNPYVQPNGYSSMPYAPEFRPDLNQGLPQLPTQTVMYRPATVFEGPMDSRMGLGAAGQGSPQGMFQRNLIGSIATSASRLTDPDEKIGIWFICQDLSVRSEGLFRLRFTFMNLADSPRAVADAVNSPGGLGNALDKIKAPVLAACFSDVFQVYSAKKFPGVCESTELSKAFVNQGVKIPIRKDNANAKGDDDEEDLE